MSFTPIEAMYLNGFLGNPNGDRVIPKGYSFGIKDGDVSVINKLAVRGVMAVEANDFGDEVKASFLVDVDLPV